VSASVANLRLYRPSDLETLHKIDQVCFPKGIAYGRKELQTYIQSAGSYCLLAEVAGEVAGFILTERSAQRGHIITLDVLAQHRRQSIGSLLLGASEREAAAQGANFMYLETATTNKAAIALWKKHAYVEVATIENYYGPGMDAFEMRKHLGSSVHIAGT
jgi:[ribosomal protein S18]-alanine N-acetyltransferase